MLPIALFLASAKPLFHRKWRAISGTSGQDVKICTVFLSGADSRNCPPVTVSKSGAHTCNDKIPIQSGELWKHLKLKCQVEMSMPGIRM